MPHRLLFFSTLLTCPFFFFFFSSRRRHTRFDCDWSSDVCSSDLIGQVAFSLPGTLRTDGIRLRTFGVGFGGINVLLARAILLQFVVGLGLRGLGDRKSVV